MPSLDKMRSAALEHKRGLAIAGTLVLATTLGMRAQIGLWPGSALSFLRQLRLSQVVDGTGLGTIQYPSQMEGFDGSLPSQRQVSEAAQDIMKDFGLRIQLVFKPNQNHCLEKDIHVKPDALRPDGENLRTLKVCAERDGRIVTYSFMDYAKHSNPITARPIKDHVACLTPPVQLRAQNCPNQDQVAAHRTPLALQP